MDKLKQSFSTISSFTWSHSSSLFASHIAPSTNRLRKHQNPFEIGAGPDSVEMEPKQLGKIMIALIGWEAFISFVVICCLGSLAAFQKKWAIGVSGLVGFMLFLSLLLFFLSLFLLIPPILYDRHDKLGGLARFLKERRSQWVLQAVGAGGSLIGAVVLTASAWSQKGCKNPEIDPHSSLGDAYMMGLIGWCRTKKASSILMWIEFVTWLAAFVFYLAKNRGAQASLSAYQSTSENAYKSSEVYGASTEIPARFVSSYGGDNGVSGSYEGCGYAFGPREHDGRVKEEFDDEEEEGDVGYAPLKYEPPERLGSPMHANTGRATATSRGMSAGTPPPRTESTKPLSRTMQMAKKSYDDPYATVKASLAASPNASPQAQGYGYAPYAAVPSAQSTPRYDGYR